MQKLKNFKFSFNLIFNKFFIYDYFYYLDFSYYKFHKVKKNVFIKNINKKKIFFKEKSYIRDKNKQFLKKFYNVSVYNGNNYSFFNFFNKSIEMFLFIFIKKNIFFYKYINYNNLFDFVNSNKINFNFNFFIKDFFYEYNSIFDIQIFKVPKKYKLKFKKKYNFELVYVYYKKRIKLTLKLFNNLVKFANKLNLKFNFF